MASHTRGFHRYWAIQMLTLVILYFSNVGFCTSLYDTIDIQTQNLSNDLGATGFSHGFDVLGLHRNTYDSAEIIVINNVGEPIQIWLQTDICIGCKMEPVTNLTNKLSTGYLDTVWPMRFAATPTNASRLTDNEIFCRLYYHFGLLGVYNITVTASSNESSVPECELEIVQRPIFPYIGLAVFYPVITLAGIAAIIWVYVIKPRLLKSKLVNTETSDVERNKDNLPLVVPEKQDAVKVKISTRLRSVDTFRGFAIGTLVFGHTGGGKFYFMQHAKWYGITWADFMFPWFMFIMGTSIHLALNVLISKGRPLKAIFKKIIFRSIALFFIGLCLQANNDLRTLRIPGVLQRFGISYFVTASSYLFSRWLQMRRKEERTGKCFLMFRDIVDYIGLPVAICCLAIHLCLTFLLPVPGCPTGYQGPGGPLVGENGELVNCTGGAAGYIDRLIFGEAHMIPTSTCKKVYHNTLRHDPEGIVGTFTSIALTIFGLQAGKILGLFKTPCGRVFRLVFWGVMLTACSMVLSKCTIADGWIPINKNLWSVSFICLTAGTAFLCEVLFHVLIDITNFWNGAPFFYAGMNSILLFVGSDILITFLPFTWTPFVGNHTEWGLMGLWCGGLWMLIAYYLYRKKIFLKL